MKINVRACSHSKELPELMENEVVRSIADKHGKTPAKVLLRFFIQKDIVVIPKSTNPERLAANIQVTYILTRARTFMCLHIFSG